MERQGIGVWEMLGATIVALILLAVTVHATVGWSEVGAAWVQAVGSVLALFVTGGFVVWETRSRRLEASRTAADRLAARVAVLEIATKRVGAFAQCQKSLVAGVPGDDARGQYLKVRYALKETKLVELGEMPNKACVEALEHARALFDLMSETVEELGEDGFEAEHIPTLEKSHLRLTTLIGQLNAEVKRLSN